MIRYLYSHIQYKVPLRDGDELASQARRVSPYIQRKSGVGGVVAVVVGVDVVNACRFFIHFRLLLV